MVNAIVQDFVPLLNSARIDLHTNEASNRSFHILWPLNARVSKRMR